MKNRSLLTILILSIGLNLFSQNYQIAGNEIVFSKVIEDTGKDVPSAHKAIEAFFASYYNDVKFTEHLNQEDHFLYKGVWNEVAMSTNGFGWITVDIPHEINVSIKDNRVRVKVILIQGKYNWDGKSYAYNLLDAPPFTKKAPLGANKKVCEKGFSMAEGLSLGVISNLEEYLLNSTLDNNDDW